MNTLSGKPLAQRPYEFGSFLNWVKENKVQRFLEIGSRYGDSLYEIAKVMPKGSQIVSVDLVDGLWGRSDSADHLQTCINKLNQEGYQAQVIFGDSQDPEIIKQVTQAGPFDLILIDGDHRLEGVVTDWKNYGHLARYVAFHDIDGEEHFFSKTLDPVDVSFVWSALERRFEFWKWIDMNDRGMGIGVVDTQAKKLPAKLQKSNDLPSASV